MDMTVAMAAANSVKLAYDGVAAALGLKEQTKVNLALSEVLPMLLEAQMAANNAVREETALLQRVSELEREIHQLKAKGSESERYVRQRFFPGSFAYVDKDALAAGGALHYACSNCFESGEIRTMQPTGHLGRRRHPMHRCPSCRNEIEIGPAMKGDETVPPPESPRQPPLPPGGKHGWMAR